MKRVLLLVFVCLLSTSVAWSAEGYKEISKEGYKEAKKGGYDKEESYINEHLPDWIDVDVEFRKRIEFRDDFDFDSTVDDEDAFKLMRTRVGVTLKPTKHIKLYSLFQDSRIFDDSVFSDKSKYENWADIKKLYIKYKDIFKIDEIGLKGVSFVLGRQGFKYGNERLLGDPNWGNVGQSFDAGKAIFKFDNNLQIDVFSGDKSDKKIPREFDDLYEGGAKDRISGYYASYQHNEDTMIEQYLIERKTNKNKSFGPSASGELEEYTLGGRIAGQLSDTGFDYDFEAAYQWGDMESLDISAWMMAAILGYTFDHAWSPRLAVEVDYASGDSDKTDDKRNTFDNLHPTNHKFYGYMDRVSLQNVKIYSLQSSAKPMDKLKLQGNLHFIFLDTPNDYLYDSARKKIRSTTGASFSRHVGNELDLTAKYKVSSFADLLVGYSHFFAGDYLDDTGEKDDADFAYVQTTLKF